MSSSSVSVSVSRVTNIVKMLSDKFNFDLDEGLRMVGVEKNSKNLKKEKCELLLPFNNEKDVLCCSGLRKASGLYLQCSKPQEKDSDFCKGCKKECDVNGRGKPDYGTIEDRLSCGLYDFRDPKGKSPIGYLKYLSKVKKSKEEAECYALKEKKSILGIHFEYEDLKRGRPKTEKKVKESTGKKGRPKKSKKEVELVGEEEDLFALLVEDANSSNSTHLIVNEEVEEGEVEEVVEEVVEKKTKKAEKEEEKQKKLAEKEEEKQKKLAEKEAEKQKKLAEKEAEKQKKIAEKEAEKQKKIAEKEAAKKNKKPSTKKSEKKEVTSTPVEGIVNVAPPKEEEQDVVRKFEYEGVTYLKSKFTGVIYNMDQELIGKWNEETKKIDFEEFDDEEEEDEYDE